VLVLEASSAAPHEPGQHLLALLVVVVLAMGEGSLC